MNTGKIMIGTALLLIMVAQIVHPAEGLGTGSIPVAGFVWGVICTQPVAASTLFSDTGQKGEENFLACVPDNRCVNPIIIQHYSR
jgi:hypothetical protein